MIEIRIPQEIQAYKEKLFFGLTLIQTIAIVAIVLINVPAGILLSKARVSADIITWIVLVNAVPIGLIGFYRPYGMDFFQFSKLFLWQTVLTPPHRTYKTANFYEWLADEIQDEIWEKEKEKFILMHKEAIEREHAEAQVKAKKYHQAVEQSKREGVEEGIAAELGDEYDKSASKMTKEQKKALKEFKQKEAWKKKEEALKNKK